MHGIRRTCSFPSVILALLLAGKSLAPDSAVAASTVLLSNLDQQPGDPSSAYICASIWDAAPFVTGDQTALK
jgi:hypothetical protein